MLRLNSSPPQPESHQPSAKPLVRLTLSMFAALSALTLTVLVLGRGASFPSSLRSIGLETCAPPCFMQMAPGHTEWEAGYRQLAQAPESELSARRIIVPLPPDGEASFFPSVDGLRVGRVYVTLPASPPVAVGWILGIYGEPCGVSVYRIQSMVTLRYPFMLVNIEVPEYRLNIHSSVTSLQFADPAFHSAVQPDLCVDNITGAGTINRRWQGWGALKRLLLQRVRRGR